MLVVRHRDRPGVLAHVFDQLREANLNVQETENIVFDGAKAAIARIHLEQRPNEKTLNSIREGSEDIIELSLVEL
jgi:D-3-phosphoglycerate dehydrogenase / 2-oxoglutarate reductase